MTKKRIAVVGDIMLDIRRWGTSSRTSPEDPNCKVLFEVQTMRELGGAGNVARWLAAVPEFEVTLFGHVGNDAGGKMVRQLCAEAGITFSGIMHYNDSKSGLTTIKERVCLVANDQINQLVRLDQDTVLQTTVGEAAVLAEKLKTGQFDAVVVADYNKGVFTGPSGFALAVSIGALQTLTVVNAKDAHRWKDMPVSHLICNRKEAVQAWNGRIDTDTGRLARAGHVIITKSEEGATAYPQGPQFRGGSQQDSLVIGVPVDVTGAGDAFTAGIVAHELFQQVYRPLGFEGLLAALKTAQTWAAHCCGQIGCGTPLGALRSETPLIKLDGLNWLADPLYLDPNTRKLGRGVDLTPIPAPIEAALRGYFNAA